MGRIIPISEYVAEVVEYGQVRWEEDLAPRDRGRIASSIESERSRPRYAYVDPRKLVIDSDYQRRVSTTQVWKMMKSFSYWLLLPLYLAHRRNDPDDQFRLLDGIHRTCAVIALGPEIIKPFRMYAEIRETTGVKEEARIYSSLQTERRDMNSVETHIANLVAEEAIALDLQAIFDRYRFKVPTDNLNVNAFTSDQNEITCIGTLRAIYEAAPDGKGKARVSGIMQIVREAWDAVPPTTAAWVLRGVNGVLEQSRKSPETIAKELSTWKVRELLERGRTWAFKQDRPNISVGVTKTILGIVNR